MPISQNILELNKALDYQSFGSNQAYNKAVFSWWSEKFCDTVALSFVCGDYYLIME